MLLLKEIQFLIWDVSFIIMSKSSCMQFPQFIDWCKEKMERKTSIWIAIYLFFFTFFVDFVLLSVFELFMLPLAAAINLYLLFLRIQRVFKLLHLRKSSMLVILFPPFLNTYSQSISSLGCKAMCIVINFLILWFICLSSFLLYFKNVP